MGESEQSLLEWEGYLFFNRYMTEGFESLTTYVDNEISGIDSETMDSAMIEELEDE